MSDLLLSLRAQISAALGDLFGPDGAGVDPAIHRSAHADFQADAALALARRLGRKPRDIAEALVQRLSADDVLAEATVSGPGFINITVRSDRLAAEIDRMRADERLGVPRAAPAEKVVVDYSAPNVAKEMHVGHLRPTIIGDALVRILDFQGQTVIRQNHIGDWGTPFGMLIEHLLDDRAAGNEATVRELASFYRAAREKFDQSPEFADRARRRVVLLQGGDETTLALWRRLIAVSMEHFSALYERLRVTLRPEDVAGESQYNPALADVVAELEAKGLAVPSNGAMCVFPPGFTGRDGEPTPLIVRKQDGGYGYATTDLAAVRYRVRELRAQRIIYVVGAPQTQHFAMVFATARLAGWADASVRLEHVSFGSVLGPDKKMLKSRTGDAVTLASLVDEAIERADKVVEAKTPDLPADERRRIARAVGVGALKYADLANDRVKDYVFDWNRMLSFDGNTAPYMMYAHARIRSILRKAGEAAQQAGVTQIQAPEERALALDLLELPRTIDRAADALQPHRLCQYLYDVATAFTRFYENCPVLRAEEPTRSSRLTLCQTTAAVLARGLDLLGIEAPEQM